MITFKDFLIESKSAPLYHGTDTNSAIHILRTNTLKKSTGSIMEDDIAVSFTRSLDFAKKWAYQNTTDWSDVIVFEVDQQKLTHNFKLKPFNYHRSEGARILSTNKGYDWNMWGANNEFEDRVPNRDIKNFDRYITKIHVFEKPGRPIKGNVILNHPKLFYNGKFVNK